MAPPHPRHERRGKHHGSSKGTTSEKEKGNSYGAITGAD
jgi:hypothetical protein